MTFIGLVTNGKFQPYAKTALVECFKSLENKEVEVRVKKRSQSRSEQQNKYYWGVIVKSIQEETGHTAEEVHEAMKAEFLKKHHDKLPDSVGTTTELNTIEFEEYLEKIRRWSSVFLNISIPEPNEMEKI